MTTIHRTPPKRRIDLASLSLTLIGVACGIWAYTLVESQGINALIIVPAIVTVTIGLTNITKLEAPRD